MNLTMNIRDRFNAALLGGIALLIGWGSATLLHECCHLATARVLGLPASFGTLTLTTGSVIVSGDMTTIETTLVAVAGSLGLIIIGVMLVQYTKSQYLTMIGVIFLCRAWIDALPICVDGAMMMESTGWILAWLLVIIEILVCGGMIWYALNKHQGQHPRVA